MSWLISLALCGLQSFWAYSKGYNPVAFFLTAGPVGWIFLAILKDLKKSDISDEEKAKRKKSGDTAGWVVSVLVILAIIWFLSSSR